ncbi:MAG: PrgI family protein [Candidatus Pacebacteria bacterium]|nr:PrgI family protein [Candidatus Paceibacterota bacterium]
MRFEVPQFINIPDKLFGPFTFKQALFLVGGGGMIYVIYRVAPFSITFLLGLPIAAFTGALVFYKPNGRPFIHMVESWILYTFSHKFYLWRQRDPEPGAQDVTQIHQAFPEEGEIPEDNRQKISDLAWSLDILDFDE